MADVPVLPIPEPPIPHLDPWIVVSRVCHDLARDALRSDFTEARLPDAVRAAVELLEALGVAALIPDPDEPAEGRGPEIPSRRVEADLRARIDAGEWAIGEPLPSVPALAAHYGVSKSTVSKAEARLAAAGVLEIVPQWGVFRA